MEDAFNVDRYVQGLRKRWWLVVGLALLGAIVAAVVSLILPKTYQATSRILVTTPKLQLQFDSRLRTTTDRGLTRDMHRTLIALAFTREMEDEVRQALGDLVPPALQAPGKLKQMITLAQLEGTAALYELAARNTDPAFAQKLADAWTSHYVDQVNRLYGLTPESKTQIQNDLATAEQQLSQAELALQEFQGRTGVGLVDNIQYPGSLSRDTGLSQRQNLFGLYERYGAEGTRLQAQTSMLGRYQAALDNVNMVLTAAAERADTDSATDLPLDLLSQSDVLAASGLDLEALRAGSVSSARAALEGQRTRLTDTITGLQADVQALTDRLSRQSEELTGLVRDRALAEETYIILALKQRENETQDSMTDSWMQVVDHALLPKAPVSPKPLLNIVLGFLLGGLVGLLGALLIAWWEK